MLRSPHKWRLPLIAVASLVAGGAVAEEEPRFKLPGFVGTHPEPAWFLLERYGDAANRLLMPGFSPNGPFSRAYRFANVEIVLVTFSEGLFRWSLPFRVFAFDRDGRVIAEGKARAESPESQPVAFARYGSEGGETRGLAMIYVDAGVSGYEGPLLPDCFLSLVAPPIHIEERDRDLMRSTPLYATPIGFGADDAAPGFDGASDVFIEAVDLSIPFYEFDRLGDEPHQRIPAPEWWPAVREIPLMDLIEPKADPAG